MYTSPIPNEASPFRQSKYQEWYPIEEVLVCPFNHNVVCQGGFIFDIVMISDSHAFNQKINKTDLKDAIKISRYPRGKCAAYISRFVNCAQCKFVSKQNEEVDCTLGADHNCPYCGCARLHTIQNFEGS